MAVVGGRYGSANDGSIGQRVMTTDNKPRYSAPAAACAADLLAALARSGRPMSIADLAREIAQTKSLVYRVVQELEGRDYLTKLPDGTYWLGLTVIELGGAFSASVPLMTSIRRVLRELATDTGETANLGVLRGDEVLYLAREEGARSIFAVSHVGKTLPANCTALGKALLAEQTDDDVRERLLGPDGKGQLRGLTSDSITSMPELFAQLEQIRGSGVAEEHGESVPGRCCLAVAVRLDGSTGLGAISVSMDEARFQAVHEDIVDRLNRAKQQIERDVVSRASIGNPGSLADGIGDPLP